MINYTLPGFVLGNFGRLNSFKGQGRVVPSINHSYRADLYTWLNSLILSTPKTANMISLLSAFRHIGGIKSQDKFIRTALLNQVLIELCPVKWLTHLVPVSLFGVLTIPGNVNKVVFTAKSHIEGQNVQNKFLSWFGSFANLCYYCCDKAFGFIEKHHDLRFLSTTNQVLFSFGFSPPRRFLRTCH